jgi:DNA invertase Pin-like site-specific DNA recombinase
MSDHSHNQSALDLTGTGAAYVRVSDDKQITQRQHNSLHAFLKRHSVTIRQEHWFKDEGWARDTADRRPDFQRLLKLAEEGAVKWIIVSERDRFGTADADEFMHFRYLLRKWGCRLYDAAGTEWTRKDISTVIIAAVEGEKSEQEQRGISNRALGAKIAYARAGEWQGGPVRLGFDVVCLSKDSKKELWRVICEGFRKRLKVYPDGKTERFDGQGNFPKFQDATEVLQLAPSKDRAKIDAAVSVFQRYATESISFAALARHLKNLGFRNGYGGDFQSDHIHGMLADSIYLGYYAYNRQHGGKFHRWANGQAVLEPNYGEKVSKNDRADWVQSDRLFKPLVDPKTWAAVQRKLESREKRTKAPRSPALYLAGLLYCGNCGKLMVASRTRKPKSKPRKDGSTGDRHEYICNTYFKAVRDGRRAECPCLRNGVFQDALEPYIDRYLEETGQRLALLTEGLDADNLTTRLEQQEAEHEQAFLDGIKRLMGYLAEHHPEEYEDFLRLCQVPAEEGGPGTSGEAFFDLLISTYRANFNPAQVAAEVARLDAEHTAVMARWADLRAGSLARQKADEQLTLLEARIADLRDQQQDTADVVVRHYREAQQLCLAVVNAQDAMRSQSGERALRQRSQALRAVIHRIECRFTATGKTGSGWGKKNSALVEVTFYPVVGDSAAFSADSEGTLHRPSARSRRYSGWSCAATSCS